jgi:hypothetical protein
MRFLLVEPYAVTIAKRWSCRTCYSDSGVTVLEEQVMPTYYHITVHGHLDDHWSAWFDGLTITNGANGDAVLAGPIMDQAALHGVLTKLRDLGLPLIAVHPMAGAAGEGAIGGSA